jgi:hypothetical protein
MAYGLTRFTSGRDARNGLKNFRENGNIFLCAQLTLRFKKMCFIGKFDRDGIFGEVWWHPYLVRVCGHFVEMLGPGMLLSMACPWLRHTGLQHR